MTGVVYTAITGGKDVLKTPESRLPGVDYICFTDDPAVNADGWETRSLRAGHPDPTRAAKWPKIMPHLHLPEYDWSLWIDANYWIAGDLTPLVSKHLPKGPFFAFPQYKRACAYEETEQCILQNKDDPVLLRAQSQRYRDLGMPEGLPVPCNSIVLRKHNKPAMIRLMEAWWRELELGSRRDQVSLPYVLWKLPNRFRFFYDGVGPHFDKLPFLRWMHHEIRESFPWSEPEPVSTCALSFSRVEKR
jgi:hypothetical protein